MTEQAPSPDLFRAYDIRGRVDGALTSESAVQIGRAIGSEIRDRDLRDCIVGRDGRLESPELTEALTDGLIDTGCRVTDLGLVPTPLCYYASQRLGIPNNVMVTGSHNPPKYNGFKITIDGRSLHDDAIQALRRRIVSGRLIKDAGGETTQQDIIPEYLADVGTRIHLKRPLRIAIDCGNGAASVLAERLFEDLGCELHALFCEVDGSFPNHHPNPSVPCNLAPLIQYVQEHELDLGLAFDGDADRVGVVDARGRIIWPDRLMILFAEEILERRPGAEIIYDIKCSRHLDQRIRAAGGQPLIWRTGHSVMKSRMQQDQAAMGGELSGHIIFEDRWYGFDDGLYTGARLLELLSARTESPTEVFDTLPDSHNTPELAIGLASPAEARRFMQDFKQLTCTKDAQRIIDIDGLRIEYSDGWYLIRASNTTPSIVIRIEADTISGLERLQAQLRRQIQAIRSDLALPF